MKNTNLLQLAEILNNEIYLKKEDLSYDVSDNVYLLLTTAYDKLGQVCQILYEIKNIELLRNQ